MSQTRLLPAAPSVYSTTVPSESLMAIGWSKCAVRVERRIGFESMLERWVRLKGYCAADFGGVDCDQAYICADVKSTSSS